MLLVVCCSVFGVLFCVILSFCLCVRFWRLACTVCCVLLFVWLRANCCVLNCRPAVCWLFVIACRVPCCVLFVVCSCWVVDRRCLRCAVCCVLLL